MAINFPKVPLQLPISSEVPSDENSLHAYLTTLIEVIQQQNYVIAGLLNGLALADVLANRPPTPSPGSLYFATDNSHFYCFDGTNWQTLI